jgi:serine/threonine-protein kinase
VQPLEDLSPAGRGVDSPYSPPLRNESLSPLPLNPNPIGRDSTGLIDPSVAQFRPDDVLAGRFVIIKILGAGGMGEVYAAFDRKLERKVAIKRTLPSLKKRKNAQSRFLREAKSIARLTHHNVVHIYDIIEHIDNLCIVMEYIEGESISQYVQRNGRMTVSTTLRLAKQIAEGLNAIHSKNIVHRDVKPSNIIIDQWDVAKLVDFGLAKNVQASFELTKTGTAIGTWEYAAPEQKKDAKEVGPKSDIYSLGATMYYMMTAQSPSDFRERDLAPVVLDLILRAMEKEPEKRFADMYQFLVAIMSVLSLALKQGL